MTIYYGSRWFLLLARHFVLRRSEHPYRRLSATLMIARGRPFTLQVDDCEAISTQAVLIAPKVQRRLIEAVDSHIAIFDLAIETPHFAALAPLIQKTAVLNLDVGRFASLMPSLEAAAAGTLAPEAARQLFDRVVELAGGTPIPLAPAGDVRITQAIAQINEAGFGEASLEQLAERAHLSPSRFRQLFKEQTGSTIRHYARWAATWRAVWLWQRGTPWTQIAHQCGFTDLAHLDHAFNEVFGLNPSAVVDPSTVLLRRCE